MVGKRSPKPSMRVRLLLPLYEKEGVLPSFFIFLLFYFSTYAAEGALYDVHAAVRRPRRSCILLFAIRRCFIVPVSRQEYRGISENILALISAIKNAIIMIVF